MGRALKAAIASDVARIEQAMEDDLALSAAETDPLLAEILRYGLLQGGKRIRPLLMVLCYRLCGGGKGEGEGETGVDIHRLAIAFEYLHGATLFHDDVIDRGLVRRGRPSVHVAYGETAAILAGDFLHARAMLLIGRGGGIPALDIFCQATTALVDGEFMQLHNARNYNLSEEDYFRVIMDKTARLIGAACQIGALVAGAGAGEQEALRDYGLCLGSAFQIIDDLLDYQGDEAATGKVVGNDFCEGKMTLPLILAVRRAEEQDRQRLLAMLANPEERKDGVAQARDLIARADGFAQARHKAEGMIADGLARLRSVGQARSRPELGILEALAGYVLSREK